jgi:F-type H+-transporting ATPase subunit delta
VIESSVARRYARALFSLGVARGDAGVDATGAQLATLCDALLASAQGRRLLEAGTPAREQRAAVEALAGHLEPELGNFLRLLVERARLSGLKQIALAYGAMADLHLGRVRAVVTAPWPLDEAALGRVREGLGTATRKRVLLDTLVDESLIGGATADVGGTLYDGSLRTQLLRLKDELKAS